MFPVHIVTYHLGQVMILIKLVKTERDERLPPKLGTYLAVQIPTNKKTRGPEWNNFSAAWNISTDKLLNYR